MPALLNKTAITGQGFTMTGPHWPLVYFGVGGFLERLQEHHSPIKLTAVAERTETVAFGAGWYKSSGR